MKILIVHNDYGKRSGEEAVVDKMVEIFESLGHDVAQLRMSTAKARESFSGKIRVFTAGIHSPAGVKAMREALEREKPDVVNVHNVYPFISPAALRECRRAGVPVVMTIHNYRLMCPTGLFMRNGGPCELCLKSGNEWGCVRYNCERSWPKSIAYAARNAVARKKRHFIDCVSRFACITDFQRRKLIEAGFPAERITVIPNSIDVEEGAETNSTFNIPNSTFAKGGYLACMSENNSTFKIPNSTFAEEGYVACVSETNSTFNIPNSTSAEGYVAYVGRISAEKGIDLIVEVARRHPDIRFRLAGAVDDQQLVANLPPNVELAGFLRGKDLDRFYREARFMVMASRWYEGFPMSILESAKYAKATIGPDHGGFTEVLKKPLLFTPGDADDLSSHVRQLWDEQEAARQLGRDMLEKLREEYSTEVVAARWADLLEKLSLERTRLTKN